MRACHFNDLITFLLEEQSSHLYTSLSAFNSNFRLFFCYSNDMKKNIRSYLKRLQTVLSILSNSDQSRHHFCRQFSHVVKIIMFYPHTKSSPIRFGKRLHESGELTPQSYDSMSLEIRVFFQTGLI